MDKPKMVKITWGDAWYSSDDHYHEDDTPPHTAIYIETVGWLVENSASGYTVAYQIDRDDPKAFKHRHHIPHGMVVKVEELHT